MTRNEAVRVLAVLTAAYPNADLPRESAELWVGTLTPFTAKAGERAALDLIRSSKFMPAISEFLDVARRHERRELDQAVNLDRKALGAGDVVLISPDRYAELKERLGRMSQVPVDAKYRGRPERNRVAAPPPPACEMEDHTICGCSKVRITVDERGNPLSEKEYRRVNGLSSQEAS